MAIATARVAGQRDIRAAKISGDPRRKAHPWQDECVCPGRHRGAQLTLATILLDNSIPIVNGISALGLLILLQYVITWASVRSEKIRSLMKSEPTALVLNGRYLEDAMREQRVTRDEVEAALRDHGQASVLDVACVVLETDGSLTVVSTMEKLVGPG